jgi:hypothetical protein
VINSVESILNRAGLGYIFINQVGYCDKTYLNKILTDQFVSSWYNDIENSSHYSILFRYPQVYTNMKSYEVLLEFPKEIYLIPHKQ